MRVAVGGLEHESSSFIPWPTPLEDFRSYRGEELRKLGAANDIIDGLVRGVREAGMDLVPLHWSFANSGGSPTRETYDALRENLLRMLTASLPVDGVLLSLHGAFSVQSVDDADGDILQSIRQAVRPSCPIIAVHDLHSNLSRGMVNAA